MTLDYTVTNVIPATPKQIYDAWLDSRLHAKMTGGRGTKAVVSNLHLIRCLAQSCDLPTPVLSG
jgi:hypothetical protein